MAQRISPAFVIQRRSAPAFLNWVSAETGFSLSSSDAAVERAAAATPLMVGGTF